MEGLVQNDYNLYQWLEAQNCRNSSVLALQLPQSCVKPSYVGMCTALAMN